MMRDEYPGNMKIESPNLEKYNTIIHNNNQLFIISDDTIDMNLLLSILLQNSPIHYICWISTTNFNESILKLLFMNHRDTFIGLLNMNHKYSENFIVVQKSNFTLHFLHFMNKYKSQWDSLLQMIVNPKQHDHIFYTSLFTIHFNKINCIPCVYNELINYKGTEGKSYPKIFQTWVSHFTDQDRFMFCYDELHRLYPKHDHIIFSDFEMKQFILSHYDQDICNQYDNIIPSAFKSDFFRYLYLYKYGGLYLDISVTPYVNIFDYVFSNKSISFMSAIDDKHPMNLWNGFMYVTPNHPIMKECINDIMLSKSSLKSCLHYTGPGVLGKACNKYKQNHNDILLFSHSSDFIFDGNTKIFGLKSKKNGTTMYKESNKTHYSLYCAYNKVFYDKI